MNINVSSQDLLTIIGEKEVQNRILSSQINILTNKIKELESKLPKDEVKENAPNR